MATLPASGVFDTTTSLTKSVAKQKIYRAEMTYDLRTSGDYLTAVIANADVINLLTIPKNTVILGAALKIVTAGTKDATTFTLQLRHGTTALGAALDATTGNGVAFGGAATYNCPQSVGTSDVTLNLVAAVSGGNAVTTANPVVKITLFLADID